jgi:hypothetical protein
MNRALPWLLPLATLPLLGLGWWLWRSHGWGVWLSGFVASCF